MVEQPTLAFANWTPAVRLCACGRPARPNRPRCNCCSRGKQKAKSCSFCGTSFIGHRDKLFCKDECLLDYNQAWRELRPPTSGKYKPLKPKKPCPDCGKEILSTAANCAACGRVNKKKATKVRRAKPRICALCGKEFWAPQKYKLQANGRAACGSIGKYCKDCRQISERILKFGVEWEPVDEIVVFERDGWCCGACGIATPKELAGTAEPNAPTLEHLYPISLSGAHSYKNCALSCRSCNSKKRNHVELEPRLRGVKDFTPYKIAKFQAKQQDPKQVPCACGCGETFIPSIRNKSGCKHGHWYRTEAGQRMFVSMMLNQYEPDVPPTFIARPYVPLEVNPDSRLGKLLAAEQHKRNMLPKAARRRFRASCLPLPAAQAADYRPAAVTTSCKADVLRRADHTAFKRSGMSVADYVKAMIKLSPSVHIP